MSLRYINARIKSRRDTKENWETNNPLLYDGELCVEFDKDKAKMKCGDGVTRWEDLPYIGGSGVPTGSIIAYSAPTLPDTEDWLVCNGQAVSRTTYADLYALIGIKYGSGDGSSTFNVPNLTERIPWGISSSSSVGTTRSAGLPNITGEFFIGYEQQSNYHGPSGCFYDSGHRGDGVDGDEGFFADMYLDASRSNPIYGRSDTVQPPAICVYYIIKT